MYSESVLLDPDRLLPDLPRPLAGAEFDALVRSGAFEDERVELLYGQLLTMSPQSPEHVNVTARLANALARQLGPEYLVQAHSGLWMWLHSRPEPDIAVVRHGLVSEAPRTAFLVVEVAESSVRKDLHIKAPLYAEADVPVYWVVERREGLIHVMSRPVFGRYSRIERMRAGDVLTCESLPGVSISVDELFAP